MECGLHASHDARIQMALASEDVSAVARREDSTVGQVQVISTVTGVGLREQRGPLVFVVTYAWNSKQQYIHYRLDS